MRLVDLSGLSVDGHASAALRLSWSTWLADACGRRARRKALRLCTGVDPGAQKSTQASSCSRNAAVEPGEDLEHARGMRDVEQSPLPGGQPDVIADHSLAVRIHLDSMTGCWSEVEAERIGAAPGRWPWPSGC